MNEGWRIARILGVSLDDLADETCAVPEPTIIRTARDAVPSEEEILITVYRGLGIGLEEAIRRLSSPGGPILEVEQPRRRPG